MIAVLGMASSEALQWAFYRRLRRAKDNTDVSLDVSLHVYTSTKVMDQEIKNERIAFKTNQMPLNGT